MSRKVCVLGLGKSGVAAANNLLASGEDFVVYAGARNERSEELAKAYTAAGRTVVFEDENPQGPFDLTVVCPGIPQTGAFYQNALAASAELISEPEYAWRMSPEGWVAISGTNGKTTTTALTAHVLNSCGKAACACGNIGDTCTEAVEQRSSGQVLVAEMSSYQLASTVRFAPEVAVLLNITPDHLAWHGSHEAYAQAKLHMFDNMGAGSTAVICDEVPGAQQLVESLRGKGVSTVTVGSEKDASCLYQKDGALYAKLAGEEAYLCEAADLKIKGAHNVVNALAAAASALAMGCDAPSVGAALCTFDALEHRIEPAGEVNGVGFYNDSKATNVDATLVALNAFPGQPVILLLGGRDKGTDLAPLVQACQGPVRTAIVYGEAGERFLQAFQGAATECVRATGMVDAFSMACDMAESGQVVLLSPACASFDEFNSFGHRGNVFKELVSAYKEQQS